jgi:hypothetical protein
MLFLNGLPTLARLNLISKMSRNFTNFTIVEDLRNYIITYIHI